MYVLEQKKNIQHYSRKNRFPNSDFFDNFQKKKFVGSIRLRYNEASHYFLTFYNFIFYKLMIKLNT